jgi:thiamine-monophosphate kinase
MRERDLIATIARESTGPDPSVILGIGDDAALAAPTPGRHLVVTTDTLVESVHFELKYFDAWHLGRKTAGVNLSDIAAMGAVPRWAFLNLAVRPGLPGNFWEQFSKGLTSRLAEFGATLLGGDTVASPHDLSVCLTLIGEVEPGKWLSRGSAQAGDLIYCSGYLGEAAAGLEWLKRYARTGPRPAHRNTLKRLVKRFLDPEPRVPLGQALARSGPVSAAIDLSDGLATDLAHMCERSGLGAEIDARELPVSRGCRLAARILGMSSKELALGGGEDFELIWTVSKKYEAQALELASRVLGRRPFRLGKMIRGTGVTLIDSRGRRDVSYQGYEHRV